MIMAPLAAGAACLGAREAAAPEGRAPWRLLAIGALLAAVGQVTYARTEVLGEYVTFPSMGFHLLVMFHLAFAEGAILALRPAHEGRLAAEIALDGILVLLGASAVVLRLALDEPLSRGFLNMPQAVAIVIGQMAVAASLLFVALLVLWRDTALAGPVVDGLLLTAVFFTFGSFVVTLGFEQGTLGGTAGFELVRMLGWVALFLSAGLAMERPRGAPITARRDLAARRARQLIIPGAALFLAGWSVDAARRGDVTVPSQVVIALMGVALAARIGTALYAVEQESIERQGAERQAARARLRAATARMNPHFLFNALHSLSALGRRDAPSAERALERLGGLLRYGLDSGDELVPLSAEWSFARDYLEMERLLLGSRLSVRADLEPEAREVPVPPFVLQPLVENAVRHGVSPFTEGGSIDVRASLRGDLLVVEVADSGYGTDPKVLLGASGVGIRGVRAQLEAHYGSEARLEAERPAGGGFVVRLVIPAESD
ncbi:MAG: hypothetical protein FIA95_05420 [Gemmatimonadetes bacterium]|nr:hypothetical protein [Gemmatimonadota bacterium]